MTVPSESLSASGPESTSLVHPGPTLLVWTALAVAAAGLAGSLYLSLGMGLKACPLCFYQRTFVMSIVAVLAMGLAVRAGRLPLLALPLATAGLGVAMFHVFLELTGKLECPVGLLELGTAPMQSLALHLMLFLLLLLAAGKSGQVGHRSALFGALLVGFLLAVASCISNPPLPGPATAPYTSPLEICRPPHRAP